MSIDELLLGVGDGKDDDVNVKLFEDKVEGVNARRALRKYTTWGKASLLDTGWTEVEPGKEGDYNFFKVTVEMR